MRDLTGYILLKITSVGEYHCLKIVVGRFPYEEFYVRISIDVSDRIVLYFNSLRKNPNESLIETFLTIDALRDLGANKHIAVIPYMGYAKQNPRFKPGEVVSILTIAKFFRALDVDYM